MKFSILITFGQQMQYNASIRMYNFQLFFDGTLISFGAVTQIGSSPLKRSGCAPISSSSKMTRPMVRAILRWKYTLRIALCLILWNSGSAQSHSRCIVSRVQQCRPGSGIAICNLPLELRNVNMSIIHHRTSSYNDMDC